MSVNIQSRVVDSIHLWHGDRHLLRLSVEFYRFSNHSIITKIAIYRDSKCRHKTYYNQPRGIFLLDILCGKELEHVLAAIGLQLHSTKEFSIKWLVWWRVGHIFVLHTTGSCGGERARGLRGSGGLNSPPAKFANTKPLWLRYPSRAGARSNRLGGNNCRFPYLERAPCNCAQTFQLNIYPNAILEAFQLETVINDFRFRQTLCTYCTVLTNVFFVTVNQN